MYENINITLIDYNPNSYVCSVTTRKDYQNSKMFLHSFPADINMSLEPHVKHTHTDI